MPERPSYSGSESKVEYSTERAENQSTSNQSVREQLNDLKSEVEKSQKNK